MVELRSVGTRGNRLCLEDTCTGSVRKATWHEGEPDECMINEAEIAIVVVGLGIEIWEKVFTHVLFINLNGEARAGKSWQLLEDVNNITLLRYSFTFFFWVLCMCCH